jgi:hypothetical protein
MRIVHTLRTTWETVVTVFCPTVPEAGCVVVVIA